MSINLKFKNYQLEAIAKALNFPNKNFQVGRAKIRIMKIFDEKSRVLETSRLEMLSELSAKTPDGKPLMKKVMVQRNPQLPPKLESQYDLSEESLTKFNEEFTKMMKEDCEIEIPNSLKNDFSLFKGLIANSEAKDLSDSEIAVIEEVLEVLHEDERKQDVPSDDPKA